MTKYPHAFLKLIEQLKKLPGVGTKSAERFAFHLLDSTREELEGIGYAISQIHDKIKNCQKCGSMNDTEKCIFCDNPHRDTSQICVVATAKEVFSIEETQEFHGLYHVLGGVLSPLDGKGPHHLSIAQLRHRLSTTEIREMVIALDSTLEGDATSLFLKSEFSSFNLRISRLAFGLPMGSSLDYVDGGTLTRAFLGRQNY